VRGGGCAGGSAGAFEARPKPGEKKGSGLQGRVGQPGGTSAKEGPSRSRSARHRAGRTGGNVTLPTTEANTPHRHTCSSHAARTNCRILYTAGHGLQAAPQSLTAARGKQREGHRPGGDAVQRAWPRALPPLRQEGRGIPIPPNRMRNTDERKLTRSYWEWEGRSPEDVQRRRCVSASEQDDREDSVQLRRRKLRRCLPAPGAPSASERLFKSRSPSYSGGERRVLNGGCHARTQASTHYSHGAYNAYSRIVRWGARVRLG
jgi:hypothetical protein